MGFDRILESFKGRDAFVPSWPPSGPIEDSIEGTLEAEARHSLTVRDRPIHRAADTSRRGRRLRTTTSRFGCGTATVLGRDPHPGVIQADHFRWSRSSMAVSPSHGRTFRFRRQASTVPSPFRQDSMNPWKIDQLTLERAQCFAADGGHASPPADRSPDEAAGRHGRGSLRGRCRRGSSRAVREGGPAACTGSYLVRPMVITSFPVDQPLGVFIEGLRDPLLPPIERVPPRPGPHDANGVRRVRR